MINKLCSILFRRNQLFAFTITVVFIAGEISTGNVAYANELLEEIIVTAQKREQSVYDVPISIVALSDRELDARRISNIEDLGLGVPGLTVQDSGAFQRRIFIRGIGNTIGSSSLVGLYLDEASVTGGTPYFNLDLRTYDLDRVEVLRGPQGTLYGQGSMGGTIRFITKKPELDRFTTKADVAASFTEGGAPGQKIQSVINVPIMNNKLGLRIAGTFENAGGWIDQPAVSQDNSNDQNLTDVRVKGLWQPTEALQVNAMAVIHRNDGSPNTGEDDDGDYTQAFNLLTTPSVEDDYDLYNLSLAYDFGEVDFLSVTSYINAEKQVKELGTRFGSFHVLSYLHYNVDVFNEEIRLASVGVGPWQWTVGGFYQDVQVDNSGSFLFGEPGPLLPAPIPFGSVESSESWAVFGDTSFALTDRFEIGAGLRYFVDDRKFFDGASTQKGRVHSLNPRVYANYDITGDVKGYASIAKGFRSGGFNFLGAPSYDPESLWTYEVGTKMSLLKGSVDVELALFYSDYKDYQITGILPPPAPPFSITSNAGNAEIKGVDWALTWRATDNLSLGFSGNYVDTEFVEIAATSSSHTLGDRLDLIPKYSYTLSATHNFDWWWGDVPAFARLDYNQQGRALVQALGAIHTSDVINMLNLHIGWEWNDNLSFGVYAQNLLNERGFIDPYSFSLGAARPRPRTVGFEVGVEFD